MTYEEARKRVESIAMARGDYEIAHGLEDQLYIDFVRFVATQEGPLCAVAVEILRSQDIDFARHCA